MIKKRKLIFSMFLLISIFLITFVFAESISFCCEKTLSGAWCQNAPEAECDTSFTYNPTSCESTSYCELGTCINTDDGSCTPNTPLIVCQNNGGVWKAESLDDIPQCQLGCCLLGGQAAFVSQTKCSSLASVYGLEIDFRSDIHSEVECIMQSGGGAEGACVFEQEFKRTCKRTTRTECDEMKANEGFSNVMFHEDYLCSAEELGTDCGPSEKTTCVEGKEDVYFVDTCGNIANIYDSKRVKDKSYWTKIIKFDKDLCNVYGAGAPTEGGSTNAKFCGNCDYEAGSICSEHKFGDPIKPEYGDYYCRDLSCEFDIDKDGTNEHYKHGESWCYVSGMNERGVDEVIHINYDAENFMTIITQGEFSTKIAEGVADVKEYPNPLKYNLPGTRHYRLICYNGEVLIEPCADFRQEVCFQGEISNEKVTGFKTAACRQNIWQDCIEQLNEKDCENLHQRDCFWYEGGGIDMCVPLFAPGFDFWTEEGDAQLMCSRASDTCTIKYQRKFLYKGEFFNEGDIESGFYCDVDTWQERRRTFSLLLGDCGIKNNYLKYESNGGGSHYEVDEHKGEWN